MLKINKKQHIYVLYLVFIIMELQSIYTILITIIGVLGSTSAWKYYEKRAMAKEKMANIYNDDCRERIVKLEVLLEKSSYEKDDMRQHILSLTEDVAKLSVKVEYLESENDKLVNDVTTLNEEKIKLQKKSTYRKPSGQ